MNWIRKLINSRKIKKGMKTYLDKRYVFTITPDLFCPGNKSYTSNTREEALELLEKLKV